MLTRLPELGIEVHCDNGADYLLRGVALWYAVFLFVTRIHEFEVTFTGRRTVLGRVSDVATLRRTNTEAGSTVIQVDYPP